MVSNSTDNLKKIQYLVWNTSYDLNTGDLGYDGPLYDGFLHMTDNNAWSQFDAYQVFVICI